MFVLTNTSRLRVQQTFAVASGIVIQCCHLDGQAHQQFGDAAEQCLAVLSARYACSAGAPLMSLQHSVKDCCHLSTYGADPRNHLGLQANQALLLPAAATIKQAGSPTSSPGD